MAQNVALGEAIRVRILCCLTFLVKVKSKVSALWGCYPTPLPPPLVVVLVLLTSWPSLLFLPGDWESLVGLLVVGSVWEDAQE